MGVDRNYSSGGAYIDGVAKGQYKRWFSWRKRYAGFGALKKTAKRYRSVSRLRYAGIKQKASLRNTRRSFLFSIEGNFGFPLSCVAGGYRRAFHGPGKI
jgi:hypothetical protein